MLFRSARCISDAVMLRRYGGLRYHSYCRPDAAGRLRNVGVVSLVRNTVTQRGALRPSGDTSVLEHINGLASSSSVRCMRARLVPLPLAYPKTPSLPALVCHSKKLSGDVENVWFPDGCSLVVPSGCWSFAAYIASVAVPLICVDASYGAELSSGTMPYEPQLDQDVNTDPIDRHSVQALISFSCR